MTTTPLPPFAIYRTGIEYDISPLQPPEPPDPFDPDPDPTPISTSWKSVTFNDLPDSIVLNNFRVGARYYVEVCIPSTNTDGTPIFDTDGEQIYNCTKSYPDWEVVEQTLVKTSPSRQVFSTNEGTELFATEPRVYSDEYTSAGITDGTEYEYARVFDEADISYIPRASTPNQRVIENPTTMPSGDEKYLIDTLTSFVPDPREKVTITYVLTTTYKHNELINGIPSNNLITSTDTRTISQVVQQDTDNVGDKIQAYLKRSYYTDGKYHIQLHDAEAPNLYDEGGELIRPQDYKVPEYQETSEGYQKLLNSVTPVTPDDILKETLNTSVEELNKLINMIDDYEFPE
jgi:hypothetical protein